MYICDKCGLCCKSLKNNIIYASLDRGDGCCKYFDEDNKLCKIYNERPLICRVDDMYERYYRNIMSKEDYYKQNYIACKKLKESV